MSHLNVLTDQCFIETEQSCKATQCQTCWSVRHIARLPHTGKSLLQASDLSEDILSHQVMDTMDLFTHCKKTCPLVTSMVDNTQ